MYLCLNHCFILATETTVSFPMRFNVMLDHKLSIIRLYFILVYSFLIYLLTYSFPKYDSSNMKTGSL